MLDYRHDWSGEEIETLFNLPMNDLLFEAQRVHREHFDPNRIQVSSLLSIKTGACPEDCGYCAQSARYDTGLERESLLPLDEVVKTAVSAQEAGASRFCMGAAWRQPTDKNLDQVVEMIKAVRDLGMETCVTLGMLSAPQARRLKAAGLDYYNHNLDTSPEYYGNVVSTHVFEDRLATLRHVRAAGIQLCSGGILGMGESHLDRVGLLQELANQSPHPESVPINLLVQVKGTPMHGTEQIDELEFVRSIAVARILMPTSYVGLSAGRSSMSNAVQALCFFAGANSIFLGERLLTTDNSPMDRDLNLFTRLGLRMEKVKPADTQKTVCARWLELVLGGA